MIVPMADLSNVQARRGSWRRRRWSATCWNSRRGGGYVSAMAGDPGLQLMSVAVHEALIGVYLTCGFAHETCPRWRCTSSSAPGPPPACLDRGRAVRDRAQLPLYPGADRRLLRSPPARPGGRPDLPDRHGGDRDDRLRYYLANRAEVAEVIHEAERYGTEPPRMNANDGHLPADPAKSHFRRCPKCEKELG